MGSETIIWGKFNLGLGAKRSLAVDEEQQALGMGMGMGMGSWRGRLRGC